MSRLGEDTDHAGPMKGKMKTSREHFYTSIYLQLARKGMWHSKWGLLVCTAGIARNLWGATKGKQFTKADTEQTCLVRSSTILTYAMTGTITHTHAHTHIH